MLWQGQEADTHPVLTVAVTAAAPAAVQEAADLPVAEVAVAAVVVLRVAGNQKIKKA